jgi:hypothetical protein
MIVVVKVFIKAMSKLGERSDLCRGYSDFGPPLRFCMPPPLLKPVNLPTYNNLSPDSTYQSRTEYDERLHKPIES